MNKKKSDAKTIESEQKLKGVSEMNQKQLQNILLNAPAALCILEGTEHKYILANNAYEKLTNRKATDLLGKNIREVFPELIGTATFVLLDKVFETGESFTDIEYAALVDLNNEGVLRQCYFNLSIETLRNDSGEIYAVILVIYDITKHILARKKIEESEVKYRTLFNSIDSGFCILEVLFNENEVPYDYRFLEANNAFEKQTGLKDAVGKSMKELAPEHEQYWFDIYGRIAKTRESERFENEAKALGIYYEVYAFPVGEPEENRVGVLFNDITERKQTEEKIRESEQRYHAMFMNSPFAFSIMKGKDMKVTLANDLMKEFWGKGKDVEGKTLLEVLPELNNQPFPAMIDGVYTSGKPVYANEMLAKLNRHGVIEEKYFNIVYEPHFETDEIISGVITIAHEVTQQVLHRKKIEESEQRFQAAVAAVQGVLWTNNAKGEMEGEQVGWSSLTGQNYKAYQEYGWADAIHPNDAQPTIEAWNEAVRERKHFVFEHRVKLKNGNWGHFSVKAIPLLNVDGSIREWVGVHTDITEQKKVEEVIRESETRFRSIANASTAALWMSDENFQITYVNQTWIDWTGQPFEKHLGEGWLNSLVTEDQKITREQVVKDFTARRNFKMDFRVKWPDGKIHWCVSEGVPRYSSNGQFAGYAGTCNDITERKQNELKEKLILARFQTLVLQAPVAICVLRGEAYVIETINEGICELWDRTLEQALNKPVFDLLPELKDQGIKELLDNVYHTGERYVVQELSVNLMRKGKLESVFVKFVYEPLRDADGTISGVMALGYEITEQVMSRKKIEESEQRFQAAVAAVQGIVWTTNAKGEIEREQVGWHLLTGQNYKDYQGFGWADAIHPDDAQATVEAWNEAVKDCKHYVFEHRVRLKNGNWEHFSVKAIPLFNPDGLVREWVGVHTNITEQKEANNKVEAATLSAQEAMKAKQQFLSNMSHEIRTPLNSIIGFANVLLKTELGVQQKEFLKAIKTSGKSLNLLINDILDLAKVDAGKMSFEKEPFEIRKSIESILYSFDLKIKEKNLKLIKEYDSKIPKMLLGDSLRLNQIFLNILSNAVKFTQKGEITLNIKLLSETNENVTLEFVVTDSGIGIADDKLNLIFNLFEQAELSTANSYGGTGLGLAIVKQLIEVQGGSISLTSKLGEGSTFSFVLPFGRTEIKLEEEIEILKPDSEIKKLQVLVAEDVALNQLLIKMILSDFGFEYEIAENGKVAVEKLQTKTYDIVLMDLQMPEMNGFEATDYIRKTMKSKIPIIALTADVTTVDVKKCKEFGMDDYISKPIDENLLYSKIVELVKKKR